VRRGKREEKAYPQVYCTEPNLLSLGMKCTCENKLSNLSKLTEESVHDHKSPCTCQVRGMKLTVVYSMCMWNDINHAMSQQIGAENCKYSKSHTTVPQILHIIWVFTMLTGM
jgi:hypothetical protein